jgi:hypothetical protein
VRVAESSLLVMTVRPAPAVRLLLMGKLPPMMMLLTSKEYNSLAYIQRSSFPRGVNEKGIADAAKRK